MLFEFLQEGSYVLTYIGNSYFFLSNKYQLIKDTDSVMLALTEETLSECIKEDKKMEWQQEVKSRWFADESEESQKRPGLLKTEAKLNSGIYVGLSSKVIIQERNSFNIN